MSENRDIEEPEPSERGAAFAAPEASETGTAPEDPALPYAEFMAQFGSVGHASRWALTHDQVALTPAQHETLKKFKRKMPVLVLAGAWCGDCATQCPIFTHFANLAPAIELRYLDSRTYTDAQETLKVNGGNRVPVVVFFSEDGHEVARYGDRTLSKYRRMVEEQTGESCSSGYVNASDPLLAQVTQDWLEQFERVHHILRLSPRLRQLNGD